MATSRCCCDSIGFDLIEFMEGGLFCASAQLTLAKAASSNALQSLIVDVLNMIMYGQR
jgi:hypothetical protein